MAIRRRVSGDQVLVPANVIEQQEAAERLAARASDSRGIYDPKADPYPGSVFDRKGIPAEYARTMEMAMDFQGDKPEPKEMRTQDLLAQSRMMNNPGDQIERNYRLRIASPLTAIRAFCVECMGGSPRAVAKCSHVSCPLWSQRMGRNRFRSK